MRIKTEIITKISKSLQGTYTDLVKKILVNELKTTKNLMYEDTEDLNYSYLAKLFSGLSDQQKEKILQVLKNTRILEKTG